VTLTLPILLGLSKASLSLPITNAAARARRAESRMPALGSVKKKGVAGRTCSKAEPRHLISSKLTQLLRRYKDVIVRAKLPMHTIFPGLQFQMSR
jgi:hypothetical protein